jgi:hypothetical protein
MNHLAQASSLSIIGRSGPGGVPLPTLAMVSRSAHGSARCCVPCSLVLGAGLPCRGGDAALRARRCYEHHGVSCSPRPILVTGSAGPECLLIQQLGRPPACWIRTSSLRRASAIWSASARRSATWTAEICCSSLRSCRPQPIPWPTPPAPASAIAVTSRYWAAYPSRMANASARVKPGSSSVELFVRLILTARSRSSPMSRRPWSRSSTAFSAGCSPSW